MALSGSNRPLAILSEGRLSESVIRALTLLSLGWLEVTIVPEPEEEERRPQAAGAYRPQRKEIDFKEKALRRDDEEIYAIISTFIKWQA